MTEYVLTEWEPSMMNRHGGPRAHRRVSLDIDGRRFDEWFEDGHPHYNSGKHFEEMIEGEIDHLRSFFPGRLTVRKRSQPMPRSSEAGS